MPPLTARAQVLLKLTYQQKAEFSYTEQRLKKDTMKLIRKLALVGAITGSIAAFPAMAVPVLQLDINNGTYVGGSEESTITTQDTFKLQALATAGGGTTAADILGRTYYISIALTPQTGPVGGSYGSIVFNGVTINVTADMEYGTPPIATMIGSETIPDLASHGIYDTYYAEVAFQFNAGQTTPTYNVQDGSTSPGTSYLREFDVDVSGLTGNKEVHFDLYTYYLNDQGKKVLIDFAPFSHDAGTGNGVPDAGTTMMLLGLGIGALGFARRKLA